MTYPIEIIARGLVLHSGAVLLCWAKHRKYAYLPGGHVEFSESAEHALRREFMEETGLKVRVRDLLQTSEHSFHDGKRQRHEINLMFHVELGRSDPASPEPPEVISEEPDISFGWHQLDDLESIDLRPSSAAQFVRSQLRDERSNGVPWWPMRLGED